LAAFGCVHVVVERRFASTGKADEEGIGGSYLDRGERREVRAWASSKRKETRETRH
jgi:hypothetical protein